MGQFSLESIAIQDKSRFAPLHSLIARATSELDATAKLSTSTTTAIEEEVHLQMRDLFNLNLLVVLGRSTGEAYALVQPINVRHIFTPTEYKEILDTNNSNINNATTDALLDSGKDGWVDLRNGKVGGIFSEMECYIYLDINSLYQQGIKKPGNQMGILLHEIGHIITYMIYCANTASVNQLLSLYAKEAIDAKALVKQIRFKYINKPEAVEEALKKMEGTNNRLLFNWEVSKLLYAHHATHSDNSIYDNTAAESLADNFATRCGYGSDLVEGLVILHTSKRNTSVSTVYADNLAVSSFHLFKSVFSSGLKLSISASIAKVTSTFIGVMQITKLTVMHLSSLLGATERPEGFLRYDSLYRRASRIREQIVGKLRSTRDTGQLKMVLDELASLDLYMPDKSLWEKFGPVARWVENKLSTDEMKQISFEQSLSSIVNNPLLVASADALLKLEKLT